VTKTATKDTSKSVRNKKEDQMCESCMMPSSKDPGKPESDKYCSLCFQNGKLVYPGNNLKEFQKLCYQSMRRRGMNPLKAWFFTFMIRFAKRWKK